ncbi:tRNA (guanine-N(1)-)-methyltransferase [Striga asiatica]|uniref:tRNA (Guanine-N(1)-)-methyltransferase n=1 Tax=Striga asiatica TaxID=4170 RepID=A0A5A7Q3W9_STRAF|nr:tRNA (guanine-N(1)-)-methyltransferase [Striga asiatica]
MKREKVLSRAESSVRHGGADQRRPSKAFTSGMKSGKGKKEDKSYSDSSLSKDAYPDASKLSTPGTMKTTDAGKASQWRVEAMSHSGDRRRAYAMVVGCEAMRRQWSKARRCSI